MKKKSTKSFVTSEQTLCTKVICIVLQLLRATVLNIFSKEICSNDTENVKNKFWSSNETLESTGEMKLIIKFYLCLNNLSEL